MISKYGLFPTIDGSIVAYRDEEEDIQCAENIEWCKASDVDAMYKDMCHELAIVMNELYDSEKALDELHEHI